MSFEKLTSRILELAGGRVLPALDSAGVAMLAKRAMKQAGNCACCAQRRKGCMSE